MTPTGDGVVALGRRTGWATAGTARHGSARLRVRARRRRAGPARPAQRLAARTACTDRAAPSTRAASPGPTTTGPDRVGTGVLGAVVYELHVGTFTPEGTLDAAIGPARPPRRPRRRRRRAACRSRRSRDAGAGATTASASARCTTPTAARRAPALRRRLPRPRPGRLPRRRLQPPRRRAATTSARFGPYFTEAHHTPWGRRVNLDRPGCDEVRRCLVDSALRWFRDFHVDALRLDAVHALARRLAAAPASPSCPMPWPPCRPQLGRPLDLVAESDLNDPVMVTPTDAGRAGA